MPLPHEIEEFHKDSRTASEGIELANTRDHDGPRNTARITKDVSINSAPCSHVSFNVMSASETLTFCPELYGAQSKSKGLGLGNRVEQFLNGSRAVDASYLRFVQSADQGLW